MIKCLMCIAAVLTVPAALADTIPAQSMNPGLWEYRVKMSSSNPQLEAAANEMRKQLASMPPEQRKMFERMMSAQGVQMATGADNAQVVRMCVSPKEAERFDIQSDQSCKQEITQRTGNRIKLRFACDGGVKSHGEADIVFGNGTSFSGTIKVQDSGHDGSGTTTIQQEGKWLGADCGKLRPRG